MEKTLFVSSEKAKDKKSMSDAFKTGRDNRYLECGCAGNSKMKVEFLTKETNTVRFTFKSGDNQDVFNEITVHGMNVETLSGLQQQLEAIKFQISP